MKVLHYGHNGAGIVLSAGLRKIGLWSFVVDRAPHPYGFKEDQLIASPLDLLNFKDYDILHSHSEVKLPPQVRERFAGRLVQQYHGIISRPGRLGALKDAILGMRRLYDDTMNFVSTPNVLKFIKDATWVPLPVDTKKFYPARVPNEPLSIGFNASSLDRHKLRFLVTRQVTEAANRLKRKSVEVALRPQPTNINHDLMHETYWNHIDVWVDRFGLDFYGFSSVEAAACGIPIVCQIGDEESRFVPKCPFVNTTAAELVDVLVNTDFLDKKLKKVHRDFAVEVHDFARVAALCKRKYDELL
jgi:hypothetical protein